MSPTFSRIRKGLIDLGRPNVRTLRQVKYRGAEFLVFANEDVGWRIIRKRRYEILELAVLESIIKSTDICIDVGANIGIFSVFMANRAKRGKVIAFEPLPLNSRIISLNLELNLIDNVEVRERVLSSKVAPVTFSESVDSAYSSLLATNRKSEKNNLQFTSSTLDVELSSETRPLGPMKIDVEGAELLVLRGAENLLCDKRRRPSAILVELAANNTEVYGYSPIDVIKYMRDCSYSVNTISRDKLIPGWDQDRSGENALFLPK